MDDQKHTTVMVKITARMPSEANVTFSVNGIAQTIPTGVFTPVREDMLAALQDSDVAYAIETQPSAEQSGVAFAGGEGSAAGAPSLAASDSQTERSGPDDLHGKAHVDKDYAPQGYQPVPGVIGADKQLADAATAAIPGGDLESPKDGEADAFNADAVVAGTVPEVTARLAALTPEQRKQVIAAEQDREQPRKGVLDALTALDAA